MAKEVTRGQVIGWALMALVPLAGGLISAYASISNSLSAHEYRLNALEHVQQQQFSKLDNIEQQLKKIENSAIRIETILEEHEKQWQGGRKR